jgi:hypothetical protein
MRLEVGKSVVFFVWTGNQYRDEVVRLFQGINRHSVRLLRARRLFGLWFIAVRREQGETG